MFPVMFLGPYPSISNTNSQSPKNGQLIGGVRQSQKYETPSRRFWGQEANVDSIYKVYLKKITYSSNSDSVSTLSRSGTSSDYPLPHAHHTHRQANKINDEKRKRSKSVDKSEIQCLQWETRQIRILKAATLEHIIEYILLLTPHQKEQKLASNHHMSPMIEEERNDVSHVMHVLFCTYRILCQPHDLFMKISGYVTTALPDQFRFVLHYWMTNYPEDFTVTVVQTSSAQSLSQANTVNNHPLPPSSSSSSCSSTPGNSRTSKSALDTSYSSLSSLEPTIKNKRTSRHGPDQRLIDLLLSLPCIDDTLYRKAQFIMKQLKTHMLDSNHYSEDSHHQHIASSRIIESDPKFVAQQLTAIDLEHFLSLKAYTLLNGRKHNQRVQNMIKNFNLLSKHVIVTILKAPSPDICTTQWINIALNLRRMKNFNSLKAVIAGLANESVFRLKNTVWSKLSRTTATNFKNLSTIVDDVDNQTLLRQTQLEIEGTAKVCLEEESFGTIPYLGTFLTDLTLIDTKMSNYIENSKDPDKKLINLEKCCEQFEIITQIHLLQKNSTAALTTYHQTRQLTSPTQLPTAPAVPRVSRVFRSWFNDPVVSNMTDNDCYKLSLALEPSQSQKK